jgi:hypothetical protein
MARIFPTVTLRVCPKELDQMLVDDLPEAGDNRVERRVGFDLGGIEEDFLAPDEASLVAQFHDALEEPAKEGKPQPLADAGQTCACQDKSLPLDV